MYILAVRAGWRLDYFLSQTLTIFVVPYVWPHEMNLIGFLRSRLVLAAYLFSGRLPMHHRESSVKVERSLSVLVLGYRGFQF